MDLYARLAPHLHSILNSHAMLWELLLVPGERRASARDMARLQDRLPFLTTYEQSAAACRERLRAPYRAYVSSVSPDPIVISMQLATFLAVTCEHIRPRAILDLGSGFSSYVFRAYGKTEPPSTVYSIDDAAQWLDKTRLFLREHALDTSHMLTWDAFAARDDGPQFDLILQDMSDLTTRQRMLDPIIRRCRPGGMIILDDMHVPAYRFAILRELDRRGLAYSSLRQVTRKRLRYAYAVFP